MAATIKNLGNGLMGSGTVTLYTVPANTSTIVKSMIFTNIHTSAVTFNLYYKASGGTARRIWPVDFSFPAGGSQHIETIITMGAGDILEGTAGTADKITWVISGMEYS